MMNFNATPASSALTFFKGFSHQPRDVGTCLPSGPVLSRQMAELVNQAAEGQVIELGPGTGPVTRALLEAGVAPDRLVLVEYGDDFIPFLREAFPGIRVLQANAFDLKQLCEQEQISKVASIVSGLPMLNFPASQCQQLIADAVGMLSPAGNFIQITYAQSPPVQPPDGVSVSLGKRVWLNAPPASLWVYQREKQAAE